MVTVTRSFVFHAAHNLPHHEGKCQHMHGHEYRLDVEVTGGLRLDGPSQDMIIDFGELKEIVEKLIINRVDHSLLNDRWPNPTAEIMVQDFAFFLRSTLSLKGIDLISVSLYETSNSKATWRKE